MSLCSTTVYDWAEAELSTVSLSSGCAGDASSAGCDARGTARGRFGVAVSGVLAGADGLSSDCCDAWRRARGLLGTDAIGVVAVAEGTRRTASSGAVRGVFSKSPLGETGGCAADALPDAEVANDVESNRRVWASLTSLCEGSRAGKDRAEGERKVGAPLNR